MLYTFLTGCFYAEHPEPSDVGIRERGDQIEYAVAMCPGESAVQARVVSNPGASNERVVWSEPVSDARKGKLTIIRVHIAQLSDVKNDDPIAFVLESLLANGDRRTAEVDWKLKELKELKADSWQFDTDIEVSTSDLDPAGC